MSELMFLWLGYGSESDVISFFLLYVCLVCPIYIYIQLVDVHFFHLFVFRNRPTNKAVKIYGISDDTHNRRQSESYAFCIITLQSSVFGMYGTVRYCIVNGFDPERKLRMRRSVLFLSFIVGCRVLLKYPSVRFVPCCVYLFDYFTKLIKNYHKSFR